MTDPVSNEGNAFTSFNGFPLDNRTAVPVGSTVDNTLLRCVSGHVGDTGFGAFSPPSVVWVRNGEQVLADGGRIIVTEGTTHSGQRRSSELEISNFGLSDAGVYQCIFTDVDSDREVITTTPLRLDTGWCTY